MGHCIGASPGGSHGKLHTEDAWGFRLKPFPPQADVASMAEFGNDIEADLQLLDVRIKQLKLEYEQYFLGNRKREPLQTRGEVQKYVQIYAQIPIKNTGMRFKFNNLRSRYFSFKRHWDQTVRKIEAGTYERDVFKANLRERERNEREDRATSAKVAREALADDREELFDSYVSAREATGQGARGVTREKLDQLLAKQEAAIREKYGAKKVRFKVVVEDGKAKLKATAVRA